MKKTPTVLEMLEKITRAVTCMSCHKKVMVKLLPFGNGYVATCPECGKLAYNGE